MFYRLLGRIFWYLFVVPILADITKTSITIMVDKTLGVEGKTYRAPRSFSAPRPSETRVRSHS